MIGKGVPPPRGQTFPRKDICVNQNLTDQVEKKLPYLYTCIGGGRLRVSLNRPTHLLFVAAFALPMRKTAILGRRGRELLRTGSGDEGLALESLADCRNQISG
jgi:hypothetical protein